MAFRLLILSGVLVLLIVVFAFLGERTLPLFDGDRKAAARAYKTGSLLLAGAAFSFAMPAIVGFFARRLQGTIAGAGSEGRIAEVVTATSFPAHATTLGYGLMVVFLIASATAAFLVWSGR